MGDLTGMKFGYLTVLKKEGYHISPSGKKKLTWLCKCDCGKVKVIKGDKLKEGLTKSCGCKHFVHDFNETREENNTIFIKVGNREVMIDKEDLNKIYPHRVYISDSGYAKCGRHTRLHRLIIDCPDGLEIDHINRNKLDNRKANLRAVTHLENMKNRECVKRMVVSG